MASPQRFEDEKHINPLRYGHLVKGQFSRAERELADVQLKPGKVLPLHGRRGA